MTGSRSRDSRETFVWVNNRRGFEEALGQGDVRDHSLRLQSPGLRRHLRIERRARETA